MHRDRSSAQWVKVISGSASALASRTFGKGWTGSSARWRRSLSGARITRGYVGLVHDRTTPGLRPGSTNAWRRIFCACRRSCGSHRSRPRITVSGECAALIREYFEALGCNPAEIVETGGHPVVYGEQWVGAPRTLLIYLMYDTQPVSGEAWSVPPLDGRIVQQQPFGRCLVARGAKNSKGPLRAFLNAVEAIQEVIGTLPVNLLLVAEGEEELGSPNLPRFVEHYSDRLAQADAALHPYALQEPDGRVLIWPGTKGLLYVEIEASGERWGRGPRAYDIHASQKAIVDNPAWRLIAALSTVVAADGNSVMVDGFYDNVRPPTEAEEAAVVVLTETFSIEPFKQLWQVDTFLDDESTLSLLRQVLLRTDPESRRHLGRLHWTRFEDRPAAQGNGQARRAAGP